MDLKKIIDKRADAAQYMIDEITHICKDFEKRDPGSKGELQACEYMADVLKNDCGCETAEVESFKENPGSFFGWIYFTISFVLSHCFLFSRLHPLFLLLSACLSHLWSLVCIKSLLTAFSPKKQVTM